MCSTYSSNFIYYMGDTFDKITFNEAFYTDGIHPSFSRLPKLLSEAAAAIESLKCSRKLKKSASDLISAYMVNGTRLSTISDGHISLNEICNIIGKNQTDEDIEAFNTMDEVHLYLSRIAKDKILNMKCLCSCKGAGHKTIASDIRAIRKIYKAYKSASPKVLSLIDEYEAARHVEAAHE